MYTVSTRPSDVHIAEEVVLNKKSLVEYEKRKRKMNWRQDDRTATAGKRVGRVTFPQIAPQDWKSSRESGRKEQPEAPSRLPAGSKVDSSD